MTPLLPSSRQPLPPDQEETRRADRVRQARAWAIAMDPVYGIVAFGLVGYLIDRWRGSWPLWTGIFAITGLVAGFYRFVREASKLNRDNARRWAGRPYRPADPEGEPGSDGDRQN